MGCWPWSSHASGGTECGTSTDESSSAQTKATGGCLTVGSRWGENPTAFVGVGGCELRFTRLWFASQRRLVRHPHRLRRRLRLNGANGSCCLSESELGRLGGRYLDRQAATTAMHRQRPLVSVLPLIWVTYWHGASAHRPGGTRAVVAARGCGRRVGLSRWRRRRRAARRRRGVGRRLRGSSRCLRRRCPARWHRRSCGPRRSTRRCRLRGRWS